MPRSIRIWVALTITLIGVLTTFLEYRQIENTLMKYNQAPTNLDNIKAWWMALSPGEQKKPDNFDKLRRKMD
jgi:hypothetical protein